MAELLAHIGARPAPDNASLANPAPEALSDHDTEARFLRAALDLRNLAEREPERARALERFATEGSEESWAEARRFLGTPHD